MGIELRRISEQDTENILKWRNSWQIRSKFVFQESLTADMHQHWLDHQVKTGKVEQFIIVDSDSGRDIGSVYLRDIDRTHRKAEFGIYIGEDYARDKGYGTEATKLILRYAFDKMNLNRVFLRVFASNKQAIRSYEKCGFIREGTFRQDVMINGKGADMVFMSVLKDDQKY